MSSYLPPLPTNRGNETQTVNLHPGDHNASNGTLNRVGLILGPNVTGPYEDADEQEFDNVQNVFESLFERVKTLTAYINDAVSEQIGSILNRLGLVEGRVGDLESTVDGHSADITYLYNRPSGGGGEPDPFLEGRVDDLETRVETLENVPPGLADYQIFNRIKGTPSDSGVTFGGKYVRFEGAFNPMIVIVKHYQYDGDEYLFNPEELTLAWSFRRLSTGGAKVEGVTTFSLQTFGTSGGNYTSYYTRSGGDPVPWTGTPSMNFATFPDRVSYNGTIVDPSDLQSTYVRMDVSGVNPPDGDLLDFWIHADTDFNPTLAPGITTGGGGGGGTPISAPTNFTAVAQTLEGGEPVVRCDWHLDMDATDWSIYRNGQWIGNSSNIFFFDTGVVSGGTYEYSVRANGVGGQSLDSNKVTVTIP